MVRALSIDKNGIRKGAWSEEEDHKLRAYVSRYGHWNWREIPKYAGLSRCGKSCRLRWLNYLKPDVKRGKYTKEEDDIIIKFHDQLGKKWSTIAKMLPGRTDNEIKNYWHTHLRKRTKIVEKPTQIEKEMEESSTNTEGCSGTCQFEESQENSSQISKEKTEMSLTPSSQFQMEFDHQQASTTDEKLTCPEELACSELYSSCSDTSSSTWGGEDHAIGGCYDPLAIFWEQPFETEYNCYNVTRTEYKFEEPFADLTDFLHIDLWSYGFDHTN